MIRPAVPFAAPAPPPISTYPPDASLSFPVTDMIQQMSQVDIESHVSLLIVAGSETTATLLSGCTYLLLNNPGAMEKLTREVRSTFKAESEINITTAGQLNYMLACLDEALRYYPPVPIGNPRVVPKGGKVLCGNYVPEDVSCC